MSMHRRPVRGRRTGLAAAALAVAALTTLGASAPALAAKGGGGGGGGKPKPTAPAPTGSFSLVLVDSTDGLPHWGQQVTFAVTSNAQYTFVDVLCNQGGALVYKQGVGFYAGWPWGQNFTLKSGAWSAGAADCTARLYATKADGTGDTTMATMGIQVAS